MISCNTIHYNTNDHFARFCAARLHEPQRPSDAFSIGYRPKRTSFISPEEGLRRPGFPQGLQDNRGQRAGVGLVQDPTLQEQHGQLTDERPQAPWQQSWIQEVHVEESQELGAMARKIGLQAEKGEVPCVEDRYYNI